MSVSWSWICSSETELFLRLPAPQFDIWSLLHLRIGNGSANRGTAIAHLSTIGTRYGNSASTASMPPKPASKLSLKWLATAENQGEKPIWNFRIDPASSIRTLIADTVSADHISETPIKVMLHCDLRVRWKVASDLRNPCQQGMSDSHSLLKLSEIHMRPKPGNKTVLPFFGAPSVLFVPLSLWKLWLAIRSSLYFLSTLLMSLLISSTLKNASAPGHKNIFTAFSAIAFFTEKVFHT